MGEAEEAGGDEEGGEAADTALKEVLDPATEEDFLRERDADESEDPRGNDQPWMVNVAMEMEKAECETQRSALWSAVFTTERQTLDAVVGGSVPPKAILAMELHSVERENIPKALLAMFIHEIMTGQQGWRPQ